MVEKKTLRYSPEFRERAVRLLGEHRSGYPQPVERLEASSTVRVTVCTTGGSRPGGTRVHNWARLKE